MKVENLKNTNFSNFTAKPREGEGEGGYRPTYRPILPAGVYIQPHSQNLVRGKKSAPKRRGKKICQGNDDKGIKGKRGEKTEKEGKYNRET